MPINDATRTLDYTRPQADGRFRCRVSARDTQNNLWTHGPFFAASKAEANTVRDNVQWDLEEREAQGARQWIEDGNDPDLYPLLDMTQQEYERRLTTSFARSPFRNNELFMCNLAPWITAKTPQQLADRMGSSLARGQKTWMRADDQINNLCPAILADDGNRTEDE